jgi:hypothetical protein
MYQHNYIRLIVGLLVPYPLLPLTKRRSLLLSLVWATLLASCDTRNYFSSLRIGSFGRIYLCGEFAPGKWNCLHLNTNEMSWNMAIHLELSGEVIADCVKGESFD